MAEGLLTEESLSVLLVPDVLLHNVLFHALCLLDVLAICLEDGVHLGPQAYILLDHASSTLILHFTQDFLVNLDVQRVVFRVVRRIVEALVLRHVALDVLHLDLKENAVGIRIEEFHAVAILGPHLVVVEVVHKTLREVENAHPHIDGSVQDQPALVHLHCSQVIVKYVCPGERLAGN